ncbi:MAG: hypothetical protein JWO57_366 [Pseudonocardiales bacterium]|nr:hypothetical protein [Pseudonocardiales bacterium]
MIERRHRIAVLFLEKLTIKQLLATQRPPAHPPLARPPASIDPVTVARPMASPRLFVSVCST